MTRTTSRYASVHPLRLGEAILAARPGTAAVQAARQRAGGDVGRGKLLCSSLSSSWLTHIQPAEHDGFLRAVNQRSGQNTAHAHSRIDAHRRASVRFPFAFWQFLNPANGYPESDYVPHILSAHAVSVEHLHHFEDKRDRDGKPEP